MSDLHPATDFLANFGIADHYPFFGNLGISEITAGKIQDYRVQRYQEAMANRGKPRGPSTIHQEIVTLYQTLKTALRHGWLDRLPDFSEPYQSSPKISHRAWFLTGGI